MAKITTPDSKVYGPHVGPMDIAIWDALSLGVVCFWCLDA